jgi:5-methylcytosine-specific restriction endonuclease McrA
MISLLNCELHMIQSNNILPIKTVLEAAKQVKEHEQFSVNGMIFRRSSTLSVIIHHGTTCVACKQTALYFKIEDNHPGSQSKILRLVFNHKDPENRSDSFMTKDHIIAKSKGGKDHLDNYQPMCLNCNREKGTKDDSNFVPTWMNRLPIVTNTHLKASWYTAIINWFPNLTKYHNITTPLPVVVVQPTVLLSTKVECPSKRIITSTRPNIKVSKTNVLIYKGYIRWYTQIFHTNAKLLNWNGAIRNNISKEMKKSDPDFDFKTFNVAFNELVTELKSQPTKSKKGKPLTQLRPATYFSNV